MSFSMLIRQRFKDQPAKADLWERAFLELQVLLACCDGVVAPAERMTLSLLSLARQSEKENREIVDALLVAVQRKGFDECAARVLADIKNLAGSLPAAQRAAIASDILRESIAIVLADDVVSDKERAFVMEQIAPGLSLPAQRARELLDKSASRAARSRTFVTAAFEIYMMVADESDRPPKLHAPDGRELPAFLAAVDQVVSEHKLGSSRAVSYFIGALAGVFWVEQAQQHCEAIGRLAEDSRRRLARSGAEARLGELHAELESVAASHPTPNPFLVVSQHLTAALNKVEGLDPAQRAFFREKVAPALQLDHDDLVQASAQRKSMAGLHRNLTGGPPDDGDDQHKWWRFWQ